MGCYLPIILRGTNCAALIDSGNLWRSVISEKLASTLGLGKQSIRPITTKTVGTAKAGAALTVLGELKRPLQLRVAQTGQTFPFKPAVVRGLDMSVNISGPWLQRHGWDHIHSRGQLIVGGKAVTLRDQEAAQGKSSAVYFATPTTVPGRGTAAARLLAPAVQQGLIRSGPGILQTQQGWGLGANGEELNTGRGLAIADQEGSWYAILCNPGDGDVTIPAGRRYGVFTEAEEATEEDLQRWGERPQGRIQALGAPTTRERKKQEFVQQFLQRSAKKTDKVRERLPEHLRDADPNLLSAQQKRDWLTAAFQLKQKPCISSIDRLEQATSVLLDFWDLFSHDGSYGHTNLLKHRIITEDVPPIKCRYRPINPALEPDLKRQLDEWTRHDVIEPANSPWSFNLVAAKKKGGRIRWCIDWRRLNEVTKKDTWPMPSVPDTIARLAGSTIYSGVDMAGAFHCIDIDPRDREKTAFATPFGSYQQKRLGFGVTNGPATYCRLVEKVLRGIPQTKAISFLDDGVIHSQDFQQHLENLRIVLQAYRRAGLKLAPAKCNFFAEEIHTTPSTSTGSGL